MKKRLVVLMLLLLGCSPFIQAQKTDTTGFGALSLAGKGQFNLQRRNLEFFERVVSFSPISWVAFPYTDIGFKDGKSPYILSADVSPHFNIGGEDWPVVLQITPRYKARILRDNQEKGDSSWPVRTPSYMPGLTVYIPISHNPFKRASAYENAIDLADNYRDLHYLGFAVFHHSNGQDGQEVLANGKVNTYNGNFSTNFLEAAYYYNFRKKSGRESKFYCPDSDYPVGYFDLFGKVSFERHFSTSEALRGRYGRKRLNASIGWLKVDNYRFTVGKEKQQVGECFRKERYRFLVNLSGNLDDLNSGNNNFNERFNVDVGFFKRILGGNTAAFLMAGYYGNDPYNIYFENSYPFVRAGIALGFFTFTNKTLKVAD